MPTEKKDSETVDSTTKGPLIYGATGVPGVAHPIKVTPDGSVEVSGAGADPVGLKNVAQTPINPATLEEQQTQSTSLSVIDDWDENDRAKTNIIVGQAGVQGGSGATNALTQRVVLATDVALPTGTNRIGAVDVRSLVFISSASSDVDGSAVLIFDCSAADAGCRTVKVCNAGNGDLFLRIGGSAPVADGSTAYYDDRLAKGESRWFPFGVLASVTTNDIQAIRSSAQTDDNVIVSQYGFSA